MSRPFLSSALLGAASLSVAFPALLFAELTLTKSNGTSGSAFSPSFLGSTDSVAIVDDSIEALRGQTFVARTPGTEHAGWNVSRVSLSFNGSDGPRTLSSDDIWTVTLVEWEPNTDGNDVAAWLNGTSEDELAGFSSPNILFQDSGSFATDTTYSTIGFLRFEFDDSADCFVEAGKAYAVYFSYVNSAGESFVVRGGGNEKTESGVMLVQAVDSTPSIESDSDLYVWIHGDEFTPTDGRDLAPRFTMGEDIVLPKNWGDYSGIQVTDFNPFNAGQSLVGYTTSNDNSGLFSVQPAIDETGRLTFATAPDAFGMATVSVYATDSGATNNQSPSQTFLITIRDREALTHRVNAATPAAPEEQDGTSWATAFADLQDALASSLTKDEIWVAAGVYYPDQAEAGIATVTVDSPEATFELLYDVEVYGGFAGSETLRSQRDSLKNVTILSGDVDHETNPDITENDIVISSPQTNIVGENARLVVEGPAKEYTLLDGFVITAGSNDDVNGVAGFSGGGVLRRCVIQGNYSARVGGVMAFESDLTFVECDFYSNTGGSVGAIEAYDTNLTMISCRVQGNEAISNIANPPAGGILITQGKTKLVNCLIAGNRGANTGGLSVAYSELGIDEVALENCTIVGNFAYGYGSDFLDDIGGVNGGFVNSIKLRNTIVWGNYPVDTAETTSLLSENLSSSLVEGLDLGGSNFNGTSLANDPAFLGPIDFGSAPTTAGIFALDSDSPMIEAGDASLLGSDILDIDADDDTDEVIPFDLAGTARVVDGLDVGAFEFGGFASPFDSLAAFRGYYGLARDGSDDDADWSGNGLANLLYYAFSIGDLYQTGLSKVDLKSGIAGLPSFRKMAGGSALELAYVRLKEAESELSFRIERSFDLDLWESFSDTSTAQTITALNDRYEFVLEEYPLESSGQAFYRVAVEVR